MQRPAIRPAHIVLLVLAGCANPDVKGDVKSFAAAIDAALLPIEPATAARLSAEERAARAKAAAAGKVVFEVPPACQVALIGRSEIDPEACRAVIHPGARAPLVPGSAVLETRYITVLRSYAKTLDVLANATVAADVQAATANLAQSVKAAQADFGDVRGAAATGRIAQPLAGLAGRLVEARRAALLRNLVNDVDAPLREVIRRLAALYDQREGVTDAYKAVDAANRRMTEAQLQPDRAAFVRTVAEFERVEAAFQSRVGPSTYRRLKLIQTAQDRLRDRANAPADIETTLALAEAIKALVDSL